MKIKIAIIDQNSTDLFVLSEIEKSSLLDENGDFSEDKIINLFNIRFDLDLKESEISWGEVENITIK